MQGFVIAVLTIAFILVAYVGPVAAFAAAVYIAWSLWATSIGLAITAFFFCFVAFLIALRFAKRGLRHLMNKVELEEDQPAA